MGLIIKGTYDHVELILSVSGLLTSVAGNFCASRSSGTVSDEAQTEREKNTAFCAEKHLECSSCKKRSNGSINIKKTLTDSVCFICLFVYTGLRTFCLDMLVNCIIITPLATAYCSSRLQWPWQVISHYVTMGPVAPKLWVYFARSMDVDISLLRRDLREPYQKRTGWKMLARFQQINWTYNISND